MTDEDSADDSEIVFLIPFLVIVYFIWSWPFTWFGQAVNLNNLKKGQPLAFPILSAYAPDGVFDTTFFPLTSTLVVIFLLCGLRIVLPFRPKHKLVWNFSSTDEEFEPIKNAKPAICSALFTLTGTAVLIFVAFHIRSDRTHRQPVITWEGPAANYFEWLLVLGWTLSYLGCMVGGMAELCTSRWNWLRYIGIMGSGNFALSFIIYCALYED